MSWWRNWTNNVNKQEVIMPDKKINTEDTTPDTYDVYIGEYKDKDGFKKMYITANGEVRLEPSD